MPFAGARRDELEVLGLRERFGEDPKKSQMVSPVLETPARVAEIFMSWCSGPSCEIDPL